MHTHEEYRNKLEALLLQMTSELETIATLNTETGDWETAVDSSEQAEADENSEADASEELSTRSATVAQLEGNYRNIKRALEKLAAGSYGQCEICSSPIAEQRLNILPSARTCALHLDDERTLPL
jgi:RNA polymerase-binding transcription factor DksA